MEILSYARAPRVVNAKRCYYVALLAYSPSETNREICR